jgi:hypothetical protein
MAKQFTKESLGCWVDGARGIYAGIATQEIAAGYGWTGEQENPDSKYYDDATDEATDYLNSLCDDETMFVWSNGDLLLVEQGWED